MISTQTSCNDSLSLHVVPEAVSDRPLLMLADVMPTAYEVGVPGAWPNALSLLAYALAGLGMAATVALISGLGLRQLLTAQPDDAKRLLILKGDT